MMEKEPVYITEIIGEVVAATDTALKADSQSWLTTHRKTINYVYGAENHIIQTLRNIKQGGKYPMVALMMGIGTSRGNTEGYYGQTIIKAIYIAAFSDNNRLPPAKYEDNFKPILFPIYHQFLTQLCKHPAVVNTGGADRVRHEVWEYPADVTDKANTIFTDFLDIIAIYNLSVTIKQQFVRNCAV